MMRTFFMMLCCMFSAETVHAQQFCEPNSIPASTPDSQLTDNGNGTITDSKTGLMWKKCLEGASGSNCENGSADDSFSWQGALKQPAIVNAGGGFAGHTDWRLPNVRELYSIVEGHCSNPAINATRFPNTAAVVVVWSGSPVAAASYPGSIADAWVVDFGSGYPGVHVRRYSAAVRLVRGGQ